MRYAALVLILIATSVNAESPKLVVHEWGTFTSFQDANGDTIPGINLAVIGNSFIALLCHELLQSQ